MLCINRHLFKILIIYSFILINCYTSKTFAGDKKNYVAFTTAIFDVLNQNYKAFEARIEYYWKEFYSQLNPFTGLMANTDGAVHLFGGLSVDIPISTFLYFPPSFAPGIYFYGNSKDLDFLLEFRSQVQLKVLFGNEFKLGLGFSHVSNASLGSSNPGVESFAITYYFPI